MKGSDIYRTLFENSIYGNAIIGPDFKFIEVNDAWCNFIGYPRHELIGKMEVGDVTHPDDRAMSQGMVERLMRREIEHFTIEKRYLTCSGEVLNGMTAVKAVYGADGSYLGTSATILDVSERKKWDERLQLAASVFTHSSEGIIITDTEGLIIDVNEAFTHITGYARNEVLGRTREL